MVVTTATSSLNRFKSIKPKAVSLGRGELVTTGHLDQREGFPLVIRPVAADVVLIEWARTNREFIDSKLVEYGALLFRGFQLRPVPDFETFAMSLCTELFK